MYKIPAGRRKGAKQNAAKQYETRRGKRGKRCALRPFKKKWDSSKQANDQSGVWWRTTSITGQKEKDCKRHSKRSEVTEKDRWEKSAHVSTANGDAAGKGETWWAMLLRGEEDFSLTR